MKKSALGMLSMVLCVLVWGSTFLVSRELLTFCTPLQVMLMRFVTAYIMLWFISPRWYVQWKDEIGFFLISFFGNTLYYLCENTALTKTYTSNVSILVSAAPLLTAILLLILGRDEKPTPKMMIGLIVAFLGVAMVIFNGSFVLHLSPAGDLLGLGAAGCWAVYSLILREYSGRFSSAFIARKTMFYGSLTILPMIVWQGEPFHLKMMMTPGHFIGILFLGLIGSGLCYVAWNYAVETMGVLKTNLAIYAIPFVTLICGAVFADEPITLMAVAGASLITAGMIVSAGKKSSGAGKTGKNDCHEGS